MPLFKFSLPCGEQKVIAHVMEDVTSWTLDEYIRAIGGETNIEDMWQIVSTPELPRAYPNH